MKLYHGTNSPESVLKEGLKTDAPSRHRNSEDGCIYLTEDKSVAEVLGCVLEVHIPDETLLEVDPNTTGDKGYMYPEDIHPVYISVSPDELEQWNRVTEFEVDVEYECKNEIEH